MSAVAGQRRLRFRETLGKGAFGTVYLADLTNTQGLHQRVAVKIMNPQSEDAWKFASRHRDEARLLAQLNHDHIVRVVDLLDADGRLAVVMEYIDGVDTEQIVRKVGALPPKVALHIAACAAGALDAAYNAISPATGQPLRVVHRDIKPANLLLTVNGGVKVLDFGIARAEFNRDSSTGTDLMGTLAFMAPETLDGDRPPNPALDTYALGLTLVRLLTGDVVERLPLSPAGFERSREARLAALSALPGDLAWRASVQDLLRRMLAFRPEQRVGGEVLQDQLLALMDRAPGEGPVPFARRTLPQVTSALRSARDHDADPLPGELTLSGEGVVPTTSPPITGTPPQTLTLVAGGLFGGALLGLLLLGGLGGLVWALWPEPAPTPDPISQAPSPPATPPPVNTPTPTAPTNTPPAPTTPPPEPVASPRSAPTSPAPTTAKTSPAPASSAGSRCGAEAPGARVITISSVPFGAQVIVDGVPRGTTPCLLPLDDGTHALRLKDGEIEAARGLSVGEVYATRVTWDRASQTWSQGM